MAENRYSYQPKTYRLEFDDLPGLEVVMRSASVGQMLDMAGLADQVNAGTATGEQAGKLAALFADRLRSWNLDVGGKPVPVTAAGVRSLDNDLFLQIFEGWFDAMNRVLEAAAKPAKPAEDEQPLAQLHQLPMSPIRAG